MNSEHNNLLLNKVERETLWKMVSAQMQVSTNEHDLVYDQHAQDYVDESLEAIDFNKPSSPRAVIESVVSSLDRFQLNTSHPCYFGVFNPSPSSMGVIADALTAFYNPQLASSVSSKWCIAVEDRVLNYFGKKFGYEHEHIEGCFTTGATEANYTALLNALSKQIADFVATGVRASKKLPTVYCTSETHHSIARAVRVVGLGLSSLRVIKVDAQLRFDVTALTRCIEDDIAHGCQPIFLVGTLGSTSAGVIDPLQELAHVAKQFGMWFHVDAAWGGAIVLVDEYRKLANGVELADSIAFDPHKWLSVPMGCGIYLSRHRGQLRKTFDVEESPYMPLSSRHSSTTTEPYRQTLQWSRRFMGLKLFMTLLVHGADGYADVLRHQIRMGEYLRSRLQDENWLIKNNTSLPVVCFAHHKSSLSEPIRQEIIKGGRAFLTATKLSYADEIVLRAGIPNFLTEERHIDTLISILHDARVTCET